MATKPKSGRPDAASAKAAAKGTSSAPSKPAEAGFDDPQVRLAAATQRHRLKRSMILGIGGQPRPTPMTTFAPLAPSS